MRDRCPESPGRQGRRRHLDRHAQPLALADDHLGLPGGQGRLRREAVQPQRPRGPRSPSRPPASTTASSSTARRAAASQRLGHELAALSSRASSASCWSPRALLQAARSIGFKPTTTPPPEARLQPLARPGARAAVPRQPGALQLALVLGFRQRRHRQPGRPPDGHRPLGASPDATLPTTGASASAAGSATRTRARRRTRRSPSWTSATRSSSSRSAASSRTRRNSSSRSAMNTTRAKGESSVACSTHGRAASRRSSPGSTRRLLPAARSAASSTRSAAENPADCNAGPEHGHYSAALCHLSNISYRLGEQVPFDGKAKLGDNREVVETFKNMQENLTRRRREARQDDLSSRPHADSRSGGGTLHRRRTRDANAMLSRHYRKPFVVPEKV